MSSLILGYTLLPFCLSKLNIYFLTNDLHSTYHSAHSGESETYDDQSGMMGFSYGGSDSPRMCFNGP